MLKKMRWRFIGAAMAAFFAVVLTLLCFVNIWNYQSVARQQDETLQLLLDVAYWPTELSGGAMKPPFDKMEKFSPEVPYMIRFFAVHYDLSGELRWMNQNYIASISQTQAERYAEHVCAQGRTRGYYNSYRYLVAKTQLGTTVLFLNSEKELNTVRSLLWITLAIAVGCLAVVFVLVLLFSRRAIAPYMRNLAAQKQFITNASHELKTPLTAISTSADVLAMEHPEDEWVQSIQTQTARLSRLITNLVTLSRLDEENPFPVRAEFSLSDALWELTEPFAGLAQARGKRFTQEIADGLQFLGDRTAIQQMVSILLDNALKYSDEGGEIALRAGRSGKRIQIEVRNSLSDAPDGDASRLFERFYRAQNTRAAGTGIGLSIAKATAERSGGSISAECRAGEITFRVRL